MMVAIKVLSPVKQCQLIIQYFARDSNSDDGGNEGIVTSDHNNNYHDLVVK